MEDIKTIVNNDKKEVPNNEKIIKCADGKLRTETEYKEWLNHIFLCFN